MRIIGVGAVAAVVAAAGLWSVSERVGGQTKQAVKQVLPPPKPHIIPPTMIGMNAGEAVSYSMEWAFNDLIKTVADFGGADPSTLPFTVDDADYPVHVPKSQDKVELTVQISSRWREGTYDCTMSPGWIAHMRFNDGWIHGSGEHFRMMVPPAVHGSLVSVQFLPQRDNVSMDKLSCIPTGQPATLLNPAFVEDMKPFAVIRFMDWMKTNNARSRTWATRPLPTDLSIVRRGASVEDMVATVNTLGADPWFNMPFDGDEDYYRRFATYVRDHLAPGHKAYVEMSNEVWNTAFQQGRDASERGKAAYPQLDEQQQNDFYYADRVREVMDIWTQVFATRPHDLVRVVSAQSVWTKRADDILGHKELWRHVDGLATAPYFGASPNGIAGQGPARVDKAFVVLREQMKKSVADAIASKAVADKYGVRFMTYEGGPDVRGFGPEAERDADAMNADPRMYAIYTDFLHEWQAKVGGLLMLYDSAGAGIFSHKEYTGQPLSQAPKMRALVDFQKTLQPAKP